MSKTRHENLILGAGVTGLAAGMVLKCPVLEANDYPGGICASYYIDPKTGKKTHHRPHEETYRFEVGGGHWIFGGDPAVLRMLDRLTPLKSYERRSSVYFPDRDLYVPYPLQNNLRHLGGDIAAKALTEMALASRYPAETMEQWIRQSFGETLTELFFGPFHELYTAGLWKSIAPQDAYKSPVQLDMVARGAVADVPPVGYNATFRYPEAGLDVLCGEMAKRCDVRYEKRVTAIDTEGKVVLCEDGSEWPYEELISTLPLNRMIELCGIELDCEPDPHTGVQVLNIGAVKGPKCPDDHWIYLPSSDGGFHRVGFYSNVDRSFLPCSARGHETCVSVYVESAHQRASKPPSKHVSDVTAVLKDNGLIRTVLAADTTTVDVAYTWNRPSSPWRPRALARLAELLVEQKGRFGNWVFDGIAGSAGSGLLCGVAKSLGG